MSDNRTIFSRSKESSIDEDRDSDNPWDDIVLRQAYDRAFNLAKSNLEKNTKNAKDNNQSNKNDKMNECFKEPKTKAKESSAHSPVMNGGWKVGSKCRAIWSQDGVEYEANITSIKTNRNQARVKFIGYNNEETLKLSSLKPSLGEVARQLQIADSQYEEVGGEENGFFSKSPVENNMSQSDEGVMFPPPPPPHVISYLPKDEQEALSAMLMSWYMSGYHTGYYQGLIAGRSPNKKK